ncbi:MAG: serine hydrolase domain-containing protein [Planctomycetota bacterium]
MSFALLSSLIAVADARTLAAADRANGELGKKVVERIDMITKTLGFSGTVLVAKDNELVAVLARGMANVEAELNNEHETLFEIASCTKPFTAIAVLQLIEKGRLSLDDSIASLLPNVPDHCKAITVRHLLQHTSGIPGTNTSGRGTRIEDVVPSFLDGGPKQEPGKHHQYWNQGYALLSEIVARRCGMSYTDAIKQNIFKPAGMNSSCFTGDEVDADASVAIGTGNQAPRSALDHPYGSYGFQYRGMGGLVTNVLDLWKFHKALLGGQLLQSESMDEMWKPGPGDYGLGWQTRTAPDGELYFAHGGSVRGFVSNIACYPSVDGAIFVLSNTNDSLALFAVRLQLESLLFDREFNGTLPQPAPDSWGEHLAGGYRDAKNRKLTIDDGAGLLRIDINWFGPVTSGYIGLDDDGDPMLFLPLVKKTGLTFVEDGKLSFGSTSSKNKRVTLEGLDRPLEFRR